MPNRVIRDSILTSASVDGMTADEERLFFRLLLIVDDFGRFDARPAVIRGRAFALKTDLSDDSILLWLARLAELEVVLVYEVRGKRFVCFPNWEVYQKRRAQTSKWPAPEEGVLLGREDIVNPCKQMISSASKCAQPPADVPVVVVVDGDEVRESKARSKARVDTLRPAVADSDDDFGPAPVEQTQPPAAVATTPDRKPRQPKLVLTGEAPSSRKPANPEHAQIVADMGRWLDRYRVWRNDPKATVPFPVFAQAWKARGIDDLMLALHGLRDDDFAKSCGPKALLSGDMIAKGVNFARNGTPRATNPYEANLESARALYRQAQANGDWMPPEN